MLRIRSAIGRHRSPILLLVALLLGCQPQATTPAPAASAAAGDASPAAMTVSDDATRDAADAPPAPKSAEAGDGVVVDLRQPLPGVTAATAAETQRIVAAVYGDDAPGDARLAGQAQGAFTTPGKAQTVYLIARGKPAPGPDAPRAMLAVFEGDALVTQFVPEASYDAIAATIDSDGDGSAELLLRAGGMQMGQVFQSLHLLSLAGGKRTLLHRYDEAYLDSCGTPVGERRVRASVLVETKSGLRQDIYRADCPAQGEPRPEDFTPEGAAARE